MANPMIELLQLALLEKLAAAIEAQNRDFEARNVAQYEDGDLRISTVQVPTEVTDGATLYQTGVSHPDFAGGNWIVVGEFQSREAAQAGHEGWIERFKEGIPESLTDVCSIPDARFPDGERTIARREDLAA